MEEEVTILGHFPEHFFRAILPGMARLLVAMIALSALGYLAYATMYKTKVEAVEDRVAHAPKRQLDNVREKAKQFEVQDEEHFKQLEQKATPE